MEKRPPLEIDPAWRAPWDKMSDEDQIQLGELGRLERVKLLRENEEMREKLRHYAESVRRVLQYETNASAIQYQAESQRARLYEELSREGRDQKAAQRTDSESGA